MATYQRVGLVLGPVLFGLLILMDPPEGLSVAGWRTVAVAALMASWWATEAIPVPATSLLPIVLFPMLDISTLAEATTPYASPVIYLLLGGFIVAVTLERWNLHRRIALNILRRVGDHPSAIMLGFMVATALLSMWVSNTASTMMMVPIALSVAAVVMAEHKDEIGDNNRFAIALLLGVAYSASIGGLGTLIGTPPNALVAGYMRQHYGIEITFAHWMLFGVPVVVVMVPLAWLVLTRLAFPMRLAPNPAAQQLVENELAALGPVRQVERRVMVASGVVAVAWMTRPLLQMIPGLAGLSDTIIAVGGAAMMFLIPAGREAGRGVFLLDWPTAERIPWGVIILFGSGMSLAAQVSATGLADWIGGQLHTITTWHLIALIAAIVTLVIFLTELTSNTGTTATILPILGALADASSHSPMMLAAPAALAASCAFMLPVATGPNAVVFARGHIHVPDMAAAGFRLNLVGIVVITGLAYLLVPLVFG
ncbi:MAG: DASS family sodium-coupled anion symporter [Alphaproteobacteria bacterium]|nr:MAG: DASS family sodium-coupled anion symporter [Alphaproteobacteria bacterium]